MVMLAYHGDESIKAGILAQLRVHADADEIVKGRYWEGGKGCAVGCTLHDPSGAHVEYETRFGIPQMLARLEDCVFEGLPNGNAKEWPIRFMAAIRPGADLSRVGWQFLHWILTDETVNPGITHPLVKDAVKRCADIVADMAEGKGVARSAARSAESARSAARSAESAARSAESARSAARSAESARSAARSAESAESAARSAESARSAARSAESAESAAWSAESAESAESAAWSARSAAWSARSAESARSARSAARSAAWSARSAARSAESAYVSMANKLIALIEAA